MPTRLLSNDSAINIRYVVMRCAFLLLIRCLNSIFVCGIPQQCCIFGMLPAMHMRAKLVFPRKEEKAFVPYLHMAPAFSCDSLSNVPMLIYIYITTILLMWLRCLRYGEWYKSIPEGTATRTHPSGSQPLLHGMEETSHHRQSLAQD